jgi:hypothetical protein
VECHRAAYRRQAIWIYISSKRIAGHSVEGEKLGCTFGFAPPGKTPDGTNAGAGLRSRTIPGLPPLPSILLQKLQNLASLRFLYDKHS